MAGSLSGEGSFSNTILTTQHDSFRSSSFFNDRSFNWLETTLRAQGTWAICPRLALTAGGVAASTLDRDYYNRADDILAVIDPLRLDFTKPGFRLTAGRHDFAIGDGFLVADGYNDALAARYSIPLRFWDGVSLDDTLGAWKLGALAANLSGSFGFDGLSTKGQVYAVDVQRTLLGATFFARNDNGTADEDLRIVSARGALPLGRFTLSGEYARQGGSVQDSTTRAYGYHTDLTWKQGDRWLRLRHSRFSGDDPATPHQEEFLSWHYGSSDWEQWYLGDIVGARFLLNANERAYAVEGGFAPHEDWTARLMVERFERDRPLIAGADRYFATESDFVLDWTPSEEWELWFLFAAAQPAGPLANKTMTEASLNITYSF